MTAVGERGGASYDGGEMAFPIKVCVVCDEEFELKPGKPGFANRCPQCSEPEAEGPVGKVEADVLKTSREANAARRQAIKDMLYSGK
jgi:hypothetical protein